MCFIYILGHSISQVISKMASASASFDAESSSHIHAATRLSSLEAGGRGSMLLSGGSNIPTDSIFSPNYSYVFGFEQDFDHVEVKEVTLRTFALSVV